MNAAAKGQRDGRTVRAERTRQALVDALLALLYEGAAAAHRRADRRRAPASRSARSSSTSPTARRSTRPWRCSSTSASSPTLDPIDVSLPLPERIEAFVGPARAAARDGHARAPRRSAARAESEVVSGWLQSTRRQKAREVERVFRPELEPSSSGSAACCSAALVAASAWTAWEGLRAHQRLSEDRARAAMRATLARS